MDDATGRKPPPVYYFAHPVAAATEEGVRANIERAQRWLAWLLARYPGIAFECSWIGYVLALCTLHDAARSSSPHRLRGMRDNRIQAKACNGIVLCGGEITTGMGEELYEVTMVPDSAVHNFTELGPEPPPLGTPLDCIEEHTETLKIWRYRIRPDEVAAPAAEVVES